MDLFYFALWWLVSYFLLTSDVSGAAIPERTRHVYSRDVLLQMSCVSTRMTDVILRLPALIRRDHGSHGSHTNGTRRIRKRGKRGGVRLRFKKQQLSRTPLPSVIMANAQSLRNKVDELQGNVRFLKDFKDCGVLVFSETWLSERDLRSLP